MQREALVYSTTAGTADVAAGTYSTVLARYTSIEAMLAGIAGGAYVDFGPPTVSLTPVTKCRCLLVGAAANGTCSELLFAVKKIYTDSVEGVETELLGEHTATLGTDSVGGRAGHVFASAAAFSPTGLGAAMNNGSEITAFPAQTVAGVLSKAGVSIVEAGNMMGILRVAKKSTAASVAYMHERWA